MPGLSPLARYSEKLVKNSEWRSADRVPNTTLEGASSGAPSTYVATLLMPAAAAAASAAGCCLVLLGYDSSNPFVLSVLLLPQRYPTPISLVATVLTERQLCFREGGQLTRCLESTGRSEIGVAATQALLAWVLRPVGLQRSRGQKTAAARSRRAGKTAHRRCAGEPSRR